MITHCYYIQLQLLINTFYTFSTLKTEQIDFMDSFYN